MPSRRSPQVMTENHEVTQGPFPEPCVINPTEVHWFPSGNRSRSLGVRGLCATCQHCGHERANKPPAGAAVVDRHLQVVVIAISNMRIIRLL